MLDLAPLSQPLPSDVHRAEIAPGVKGTAQTIETMKKLIELGKRNMDLRVLVGQIIAPCAQKDYYCYAEKIHDYVCHKIKYAYDPVDIELVEDPMNIVKAGIADCDSKCILFCAMCEQVGLPCRLVTLKSSFLADEFTHVFSEVNIKGKWVTSDCTMPREKFGWKPPADMPRQNWAVSESAAEAGATDAPGDFMGLGRMGCGCTTMMAELGLGEARKGRRPARRRKGMRGLGELDTSVVGIIQAVMDGTYYDDLRAAKADADNDLVYTYGVMTDAQRAGQSDLYNQATAAYQAALDNKHSVQNEIQTYSKMVNAIQTYSFGAIRPRQLAEVTTAVALAGIAAVSLIAYELSAAYQSRQQTQRSAAYQIAELKSQGYSNEESKQILDNHPSESSSDSGLTSSIGTTVLVAAIGALLFMGLKKRGTI